MRYRTFVLMLTLLTPVQAVVLGLLTDNPNWPWNIPFGLALGYVAGLLLWPLVHRLQVWLDKKDAAEIERKAAKNTATVINE